MDDEAPPLIAEEAERSFADEVRQLVDDGRTLLEAELAYQKSRAAVVGLAARSIAGWLALALALLFFALMALVMGALLALTPLVGGWGATAIVVLVLLVATGLSGWIAARRWERTAAQLTDQEGGR
jgi:positive regulator of sigma E activity